MTPEEVVQAQLDAYNAKDMTAFAATYGDTVQIAKHPSGTIILSGKQALINFYRQHRFNLPDLHAQLLSRITMGDKVIDHERVTGLGSQPVEAVALYQVQNGLIQNVWFLEA